MLYGSLARPCGSIRQGFLRFYPTVNFRVCQPVERFRLFGIADRLNFSASTEQGLPARRPCTRALSVPWLNHCPLPRVTLISPPG
jgi:hypothetical protein